MPYKELPQALLGGITYVIVVAVYPVSLYRLWFPNLPLIIPDRRWRGLYLGGTSFVLYGAYFYLRYFGQYDQSSTSERLARTAADLLAAVILPLCVLMLIRSYYLAARIRPLGVVVVNGIVFRSYDIAKTAVLRKLTVD